MVMAMKYKKAIVFFGAFGALVVMTILSSAFGAIITKLISKLFTDIIVTILFFYYGGRLLWDAYHNTETDG